MVHRLQCSCKTLVAEGCQRIIFKSPGPSSFVTCTLVEHTCWRRVGKMVLKIKRHSQHRPRCGISSCSPTSSCELRSAEPQAKITACATMVPLSSSRSIKPGGVTCHVTQPRETSRQPTWLHTKIDNSVPVTFHCPGAYERQSFRRGLFSLSCWSSRGHLRHHISNM